MRFKIITVIGLIGQITASSVSIVLAIMEMGPWALVLGGLAGATINALMLLIYTRWVPRVGFQWRTVRRLGNYGAKMTLNNIIIYLRQQINNLIISHQLGPAQLGLYNKAMSLSEIPSKTIVGSLYETVFRALSKEQEDLDRSRYIYFRSIELVSVYTFPVYIGLIWLSEPFIVAVYGQKWVDSALPLKIIACVGFFRCLTMISGAAVAAQNRLGKELLIQAESWFLLVTGCVLGLHWGIVGVAYGILPSIVYLSLRLSRLANRCLNADLRDLVNCLKPALLLNTSMSILLFITSSLLPDSLHSAQPVLYMLIMGGIGGLSYTLLFLYAPIPALATESLRWRRRLHLIAE
jgi:O-antigen/teichoic acid export membrane protein